MLVRLSIAIEKKAQPVDFIRNQQEAFDRIEKEIQLSCRRRKRDATIYVKVIGLRGRYVTSWLDRFIRQNFEEDWFRNIEFQYYIIEPEFAKNVEGLEKHLESIVASKTLVKNLAEKVRTNKDISSKTINISLIMYYSLNCFQAFLIADRLLFLSYFLPVMKNGKAIDWEGPARNPYYCYNRDKESDRFLFNVIEGWLDFYKHPA